MHTCIHTLAALTLMVGGPAAFVPIDGCATMEVHYL